MFLDRFAYIGVRTYVIHLLGTYVTILSFYVIGLSFDKTHFTYILVDLGCVLNASRNHVSRSSVEAFKFVQENKLKVQSY